MTLATPRAARHDSRRAFHVVALHTQPLAFRAAGAVVLAGMLCTPSLAAVVSGELKQWHAVAVTFDGPASSETATPNPFTDYRLDVTFTGPSAQVYRVPGYYAADGDAANTGATSGNKWRVKFCPDAAGSWHYVASFVTGSKIAASPTGGTSAGFFDGASGTFSIAPTDKTGLDLRGKGKLEYVGEHYLRFRNGVAFIKSGSNIPETFLEFNDFDGTPPNLDYSTHVADWRTGDPTWAGGRGKGIIGALNYLSGLGINSMYFVTMNNYGDGQKSWPWIAKDSYYNYDCSKLDQWDVVFAHMDKVGIMLHVVLTETENESYFEVAELGLAGGFAPSRKIYYRELIARFGHHLAITWNVGEENGWDGPGYGAAQTTQQRKDAADYIRALTFYADNISVHNGPSTDDSMFTPLLGYAGFTGNEIQWTQGAGVHPKVLQWRTSSQASGHRWVVSLDEPWSDQTDMVPFRTLDVWGSYLAGAAGCEYFQTGDAQFDDFRQKESYYLTETRARLFVEGNVPFASMDPADGLLSGAAGYVLARSAQVYLVYLTAGGAGSLDLTGVSGTFTVRWFDPRNGGALQTGSVSIVTGGGVRSLGSPPNNPSLDWTILVGSGGTAPGEAAVSPQMKVTAYDKASGAITIGFGSACLATGYTIIHGPLSGVASYTYTGQVCGIGTSGTATFNPGAGNRYWIVAGTTASAEGSYGTSSSGTERPEAIGLAACDLPQGPSPGC
ncbi:MAG TPA: DUF5060 domain-containing protein [Candidatus Polarisedimenticolaceae bacterium]|nr:DUF5060 domain-containing protein [Candidatus Polarisedimenticolaceae bacterium]